MDIFQAQRLCAHYELGKLLIEPLPISGGLLHHMWRLTTERGTFAVKELNPAIMRKPGIQNAYRLTERIAADMAARGIPAVAALACHGDQLCEIEGTSFILYAWQNGKMLTSEPATPALARQMGALLGRMHTLNLTYPDLPPLQWEHFHDEDWDVLTFQGADMGLPWSHAVRAALPRLLEWSHLAAEADTLLSQTLVVTHRDLDQKNVLWQDAHTPHIVDWEAAGLMNPTMELVGLALNWSGQIVGKPQESIFAAVMEGYVQAGGVVHDPGITALQGFVGTWLGWLLFNMRRSLGESVSSEEERLLGISETTFTLAILRAIHAEPEKLAAWVDKWR